MKKPLRQKIIQTRNNLNATDTAIINQKFLDAFTIFFNDYITPYTPKIIGGYFPINNEINVLPALDYCRHLNYQTALPFCHGKNTDLTYHVFNGDITPLSPDILGIPAPNPNTQIIIPDIIICPSVGVCTHTKKRLGYGGGFYDKYAEKYPHIHFISGFCDYQIIDNPDIFMQYDLHFFHIIKI